MPGETKWGRPRIIERFWSRARNGASARSCSIPAPFRPGLPGFKRRNSGPTTFIDTAPVLRKVIRVTRIYDLVMTHQLDTDDYFIHCIQRFCAEARLNFFLIDPVWVGVFYEYLKQGKIWARALLNMHSEHHEPQDIFHQLIELAAQMNTQVIDPPDRAAAAFNKAQLHPRLLEAGI